MLILEAEICFDRPRDKDNYVDNTDSLANQGAEKF